MKNSKILAFALLSIFTFSSCNNDDPIAVNEEELITTVTTTLTSAGSPTITMISRDLDGDGPNSPVVTVSSNLAINTTYTGAVTFKNESVTPIEDITVEIKEEGDEHQLFFQTATAIGAFTYADADKNGKPIGLAFTLKTGTAAATGYIIVVLRHEPIKNAAGVAGGSITNAGGNTDAEVKYSVVLR